MGSKPNYKELEVKVEELERENRSLKESLDEVAQNKERLSQILQQSSIPTFVIDKDHTITHCNKAYENLTGLSAEDIIGTNMQWRTFYPKERPVMADFIVDESPEEEIARYYEGRQRPCTVVEGGYESEAFFPHIGEKGKWLYFTAAPLKDEKGRVTGAIETLQDISDRKEAEEKLRRSERRVRTLLDFIPQPIVVFTLEGRVYYLNPAFTNTFGWTLEELQGKTIPYTPEGLEEETRHMIKRLFKEKIIKHYETKRLTKDGRVLDVAMRGAVYSEFKNEPAGELVTLRDITQEKRIARNNEAILRISTALPEYPDLEDLSDYVSHEVKRQLDSEGSLVILLDEEKQELFFLGAAYDDPAIQKRVKEIRFPIDKLVAGKVIKTGKPMIVSDPSGDPELYRERDEKLGYHTRNLLLVPLRSSDRIIGVLCAINKKTGDFEESDTELLNMIAGTVALSIENARFSEDLKQAYRTNATLLRISTALPEYNDLEELLDYVSNEVKRQLDSEGSLVILLDEEKQELFFLGAAYDDPAIQSRVKDLRFPIDKLVAGKVIKTGKPMVVSDPSGDPELYRERDEKLGYHTRNLLLVPLRSSDRIIGVLCAINKKGGEDFTQNNVEILNMIAGTVALSIENAKYSEELKTAYREVSSLNRAKDKAIIHLSHELKTPVSVLYGSLDILNNKLASLKENKWKPTIDRAKRNLNRIVEIQNEAEDIMQGKEDRAYQLLSIMVDQCSDELETLFAQEFGEGHVIERIRKKLDEIYGAKEVIFQKILLNDFVAQRIEELTKEAPHRHVEINTRLEPVPSIYMPKEQLQKVVDGLVKNAVENTPDGGLIDVMVYSEDRGVVLVVQDYGVGITEENQRRIFDGFFATQETLEYSSKRPYDFNAGGKGSDLLRMKIFSERYNFKIDMTSTRCRFMADNDYDCPGRVSDCYYCNERKDCVESGGTTFTLYFPQASAEVFSEEEEEQEGKEM